MTQRERDILKASVSWTDKTLTVNEEKAFQAGAEWADKTMIEKATQWFKDRFYNGGMHLLEEPNGGYREAYDICCDFESMQEMVIDFLKAMQE